MKTQALESDFEVGFFNDIQKICTFFDLPFDKVNRLSEPLVEHFRNYWEMVFDENGFELITSGEGKIFSKKLTDIAMSAGLNEHIAQLFLQCALTFPDAITGIKLSFAANQTMAPTLYVRTKTYVKDALLFLRPYLQNTQFAQLKDTLSAHNILYGLGFSQKENTLYLKTYTIDEISDNRGEKTDGFISYRFGPEGILKEHKVYLPKSDLRDFESANPGIRNILTFLSENMHYKGAGHWGILYENDVITKYKVYLELIGGIPTDYSAK